MPDVQGSVEVAKERSLCSRTLRLLGHHPDVLGGVQRDAGAGEPRELARPQPGGEHHRLGLDRPARRIDPEDPGTRRVDAEPGHLGVGHERHPAVGSTLREGQRRVPGVHRAVGGEEDGADQVVDDRRRPVILHRRRLDHLYVDPRVSSHRDAVEDLLHARLGAGHGEGSHPPQAGLDSRLTGQALVRVRVGARQGRERVRAAYLRDQAGGVPCRAVRETATLKHDHVGLAFPREVVGDRGADDAAADDHDAGTFGEVGGPHHGRGIDVAVGQTLRDHHARKDTPRRLRRGLERPMEQACEPSCSSRRGWHSGR